MEIATSLWFLVSFTLLLSDGTQPLAAQYLLAARVTTENMLVWTIYESERRECDIGCLFFSCSPLDLLSVSFFFVVVKNRDQSAR